MKAFTRELSPTSKSIDTDFDCTSSIDKQQSTDKELEKNLTVTLNGDSARSLRRI